MSEQLDQVVTSDLLADIEDVFMCDITPIVMRHAVTALEAHPLRGMDAIHLGASTAVDAHAFVSDVRSSQHAADGVRRLHGVRG